MVIGCGKGWKNYWNYQILFKPPIFGVIQNALQQLKQ